MVTHFSTTGTEISDSQNPAFDVDSGTDLDRVLLALLTTGDNSAHSHPNTPTYNGVGLTQVGTTILLFNDKRVGSLWRLHDPASGSNSLTVDLGAARNTTHWVVMVLHAAATVGASDQGTGSDATPTVTFTPNNADSLLCGFAFARNTNADPYGTPSTLTERFDSADPVWGNHSNYAGTKTGSGSQTLDVTQSQSVDWGMWGVEVTDAGLAVATYPPFPRRLPTHVRM